jgi:Protein of unknown function (DUF2953)
MDTLLIPLFISACILFLVLLPALLLYTVPIRCAIAYFQDEDRRESAITFSWGPVASRITRSGGTGSTTILLAGRKVHFRTDPVGTEEAEPPFTNGDISHSDLARHILPAVRPLGRFCLTVFHQIRIEEITGTIRIGLEDPVATGMVYGGYWASRYAMNASRIYVSMDPVFGRKLAECDLVLILKIPHPLVILPGAVHLVRDPHVQNLMGLFRPVQSGRAGT